MEYLSPTNVAAIAYLAIIMPWSIGSLLGPIRLEQSARWLIGCGIAYLLFFTLYAAQAQTRIVMWSLPLLSIVSIAVLTYRNVTTRKPEAISSEASKPWPSRNYVLAFGLMALPFLLENMIEIAQSPLEAGDALACYYNKAKYMLNGLPLDGIPYAHYPNFPSVMWALPLYFTGDAEFIGRMCFPFFLYVAMLNLVAVQLRDIPNSPDRWAQLTGLIAVFISALFCQKMLTYTFAGTYRFFGSGYVDCMVLVFGLVTFVNFIYLIGIVYSRKMKAADAPAVYFALFMAGLLANTKNEGTVYAAVLIGSFFACVAIFQRLRHLNFLVTGKGLAIFGFMAAYNPLMVKLFGHKVVDLNGEGYSMAMFLSLLQRLSRVPFIMTFYTKSFRLYWIEVILLAAAAGLCSLLIKKSRPALLFLSMTYVGMVAFCGLPQLFVDDKIDYKWLLSVTFERLFFQHYFIYVAGTVYSSFQLMMYVGERLKSRSLQSATSTSKIAEQSVAFQRIAPR